MPNCTRYAEGANKPHYLVSEIFLPVDNPDQDAKALKDAAERRDASSNRARTFAVVAHQFSQIATAAAGGDIGWVHDGQLAPELNTALTKMTVGRHVASRSARSAAITFWPCARARNRWAPRSTAPTEPPPGPTAPCRWRACCCRWAPAPTKDDAGSAPCKIAANIRAAYQRLRQACESARADEGRGLYGSGQHEARRSQPRDPEGAGRHPARRNGRAASSRMPASK